ncbi:hypothetical protein BDA96_10G187000 [Sorghum bicolor]|uniref:J domain-containing protein n=2 Tax=Sorghum bicolor TaxID=4558 RepID=C5Z315_SORBI|nr:uncharacterized protein LOC8085350 [Sorghum bicolor]EER89785.1 hypothetical protein SORBI_3010G143400 [Sorghum bicolor]KAG0514387.1 hypothetical protein BDA96_10G187000 [Sorghum bicolor]|eukprot:XP_002438418.1 uncharacterized protein LOC8085350 [Sorghum bicolor]
MVGFFGTSAASDHCHLLPKNGSVHHELIRPHHNRSRSVIRCCSAARGRTRDYYYQVLGITVHSTPQEIKEAYRKLQKKHHPDIAGYKGHDYTLLLNEAYKVLMRDNSMHAGGRGRSRVGLGVGYTGDGYSSWNGPVRSQALFVDENKCIGCRECVHHAARTFAMDDVLGSAHVEIQFGDLDQQIQLAVESCPVNCIHWVESHELPVLEFLSRPQPKEGHGIFGGGWERPRNVFAAAQNFAKRLEREEQELERDQSSRSPNDCEAETEAQAKARRCAGEELRWKTLFDAWNGLIGCRKPGTDR